MKKVTFVINGLNVSGTVFYPEKLQSRNPAILFVHGWTSEQERSFQYAKSLSALGFICLLFDMRGHGNSEGDIKTFTVKDFLDDVLAAYDYLVKIDGVDKENISAIGSSFGSYLLALLSTKRKIKNLSLRVPADYPNEEFTESKFKFSGSDNPYIVDWRGKVKSFQETFALQAIHNFDGNIQIIESEKDTIVPHQTIQNYCNAIKNKNKLTHDIMKNAPHSIQKGPFRDQVERILVAWFRNKL